LKYPCKSASNCRRCSPALTPRSQDKIARRQIDDADDPDLESANAVAVGVAADNRDVVGGAGLIDGLVAKLAGLSHRSAADAAGGAMGGSW
jgi:hypothetical protein